MEVNFKVNEMKINKKQLKKIKNKFKLFVKKVIFIIRYKKQRLKELRDLQSNFRPNTQKYFAVEYMIEYPFKFVNQGNLLAYCDERRYIVTDGKHKGYRDNSRGIESLRKDKFPLRWIEIKINKSLYFKYIPQKEEWEKNAIINHANKKGGFLKKDIKEKLKSCNYKCELTGLPMEEGKLAADHWNPKEKGGENTKKNCVIINKIINEKKNNTPPLEWFCNHLLNNFMKICRGAGMDIENVKNYLIKYINEW